MANNYSSFLLLLAIVLIAVVVPSADSATVIANFSSITVQGSLPATLSGFDGNVPIVLQTIGVNVGLSCNGSLIAQATTGLFPWGGFNIVSPNVSAIDPLVIGADGFIPCNVTATVQPIGSFSPSNNLINISARAAVARIIVGNPSSVVNAVAGFFGIVG